MPIKFLIQWSKNTFNSPEFLIVKSRFYPQLLIIYMKQRMQLNFLSFCKLR